MKTLRLSTAVSGALFLVLQVMSPAMAQYVDPGLYASAVASLQGAGVIDTVPNVRLHDPVNRAEALKIILLAQGSHATEVERMKKSLPPISLFPDVNQKEWYAPYVEVGFHNGLIKGYPDGRFVPQGGVKVVEAAAMLTRAFGEATTGARYQSTSDLPNQPSQWYTGTISVIHARNAVLAGSRLSAGNYMTRGQLFDMVYRMREVHRLGIASFPASSTVSTPRGVLSGANAQFASQKPFAITIPALGIVDLTVTHPADPFTDLGILEPLDRGVGHLFGYPGGGSKVMIYGHSSGYPWEISQFTKIFRTIDNLKPGDRVYVTHEGTLHVYEVTKRRTVVADDPSAFEPDDNGEELVLYTCWPPDSAEYRLLVFASPVETVALAQ